MVIRNEQVFFSLIQAGLWEREVKFASSEKIDFNDIYKLAEEQSVMGLVLASLEHADVTPQKELLLQWIGEVQLLEQRNKAMNVFVAKLIEWLRSQDIYAFLVKGQGVAQCYERPLWRTCGDVDLLLSADNYNRASAYLKSIASSVDDEDKKRKHLGLVIGDWVVELHGTLHTRQLPKLNKVVDEAQKDVFCGGSVRVWQNGNTPVFLPSADNDVIFVFGHILQHYFGGGIGLRQICDWCRLLWTYKDLLNHGLLESRIHKAGIMTEWKSFAALAVNYLGMPAEAMPLYSPANKWSKKADRIIAFILKNGNFGHNRDNSFRNGSPFEQKIGSLKRYTADTMKHITVFPLDSVKVLGRMVINGISDAVGNRNLYDSEFDR